MNWEIDSGLQKMTHYCAYQDRCKSELVTKLRAIECPEENMAEVLEELKRQGFWNEERFVRSFVRGKFRQKGWGKMKIRQALWQKRVGNDWIDLALEEEIKEGEYRERLEKEMTKKSKGQLKKLDFIGKQKLRQWLMQRGFESGLISEVMSEMEGS